MVVEHRGQHHGIGGSQLLALAVLHVPGDHRPVDCDRAHPTAERIQVGQPIVGLLEPPRPRGLIVRAELGGRGCRSACRGPQESARPSSRSLSRSRCSVDFRA
jgi:hypothetical protein